MAIAYISSAQANSASSQVSSEAITIPAGYVAGSACFLLFQSYSGSGGSSTLTVTSTGSTWTQLGSTVYVAGTSSQNNASLWYLEAASTDAGKVVTVHTSVSNFVNATMVAYSGAATSFIDVSNVASTATLSSTAPMPSVNTVAANDWAIYVAAICNGSAGFSAPTTTGITNRFANIGSDSGIAAIGDSNGSVGAGGTTIGGAGHLYTPSSTGDYVTWTVGLAPVLVPSGTTAYIPLFPPGLQSPAGWAPLTVSQTSVPLVNAYDSTGALGTGAAYNPVAQVTALDQTGALGTGAAYNPVAQVTALPAAALGTGAAYNPVAQVTALPAAALGTGTAYAPFISYTAGAALGTGAAYNPVAQVTALPAAALGTGTAYNPVAQVTALPGAATGTGAANKPGWGPGTTTAAGTGAAYLPGWGPGTAAAAGTGAAYLPGWGPGTTTAAGTGAAYQPALGPATAAGTAVAYQPGWGPGTTTAAGTGAALKPAWGPGTTAAAGTGAAYNPVAQVTAKPAAALGTGAAYNPVAQVTALPAAALGTGTAYAPFISYTAGAALGTGAAGKPGWGPGTTAAAGIGAAYNPVAQVTAFDQTGALGTGTAYNIPFHADNTVFPGVAAGTGNTYLAGWGPVYDISAATGTAYGGDTAPGFAQVTALPGAALGTGAAYVLTAGFAPGAALGTGTVYGPYISYTAGAALGTAAAGKPGWGPVAGVAAGTGAGYTVALVKLTVFPGAAPATAVAYGTVELSPALEGYGFGTFPQVPNGAIILSVVADVVWTGSNTGIQAPAYELWNGISARIGAPVTGVASTTAGHRDSVVFTGVVYSQLATLRLRVYAASLLSNAGASASFDAVSLSVVWAPNTNAATAPVTLTVVPVFPAVSVSNGITITPAVAVAAGTAYQPVGTGNISATALPGVLVIIPVFPAVRISIGQTITPGVLAIVPLLPLIIDITGPGWAASDDQPVGGTGSWVNPGNITGPPDGSVAVWTSV